MIGRRKVEMRSTWLKEGKKVVADISLKPFMVE